jgi:hypothetical protein
MSDTPDTIVLIHGLWMTPLSWEYWIDRRIHFTLGQDGWEDVADYALPGRWRTPGASVQALEQCAARWQLERD